MKKSVKKRMPRIEYVLGFPVKCYDNGGRSYDQYTVLYMHDYTRSKTCALSLYKGYDSVGMSESPYSMTGFNQHCEGVSPGSHLGKRILFRKLPPGCQKSVKEDIREIKKEMRQNGIKL